MSTPEEAADFTLSQVICAVEDIGQYSEAFPATARAECTNLVDFGAPVGWVACGTNVILSAGQPPCFEGFCLKQAAENFKAGNVAE